MADFVLVGKDLPSTESMGVMTQGIGFPLRDVDPDPGGTLNAQDINFNDPTHPLLDDVAKALVFLLLTSREYSVAFGRKTANGGARLGIAGVTGGGFVVPASGLLSRATLGRSDMDAGTIEVLVDGAVVHSLPSSATATVYEFTPVVVPEGATITARNIVGGIQMKDVVLSLFIKQVGV